jgi:hypothetical protein
MFSYNIMKYSARRVLAEHGYRSALSILAADEARFRRVLRRHGIGLKDPAKAPTAPPAHRFRSRLARSLAGSLDRLGARVDRRELLTAGRQRSRA